MRTLAILPVKSFSRAKQRLKPGLDPELRSALAEAMLLDVLDALDAATLDGIIVVSRGKSIRRIAQERGVPVIDDREEGHNPAAAAGVRAALAAGAERALLVPGDCPALDPVDIDELLGRAVGAPSAVIVPDRHGTGTNALLLTPPSALAPSFGAGSCQRHLQHARGAGTHAEVVDVASLALDIDTPDDLAALAAQPGRALHTHELLLRC